MLGLLSLILACSVVAILGMQVVWYGSYAIGHGLNRRPITTIMLCVVVVLLMVSFGHYMGFDRCYFDESRCV